MRTITAKLTRIYLIVAISVLVSSGLISQLYLYHHARAVAHENLSTQAVALAGNLESAVAFGDAGFAQQTLHALQHYPDVRIAAVVLPDGKFFAEYVADGVSADAKAIKHDLSQGDFMGADSHGVTQAISLLDGAPARLVLVAGLEKLNWETLLILVASTVISLLILFAAYTLFRGLTRTVTRPIEELTGVMRRIENEGDHSQRTEIVSDDEIGELAKGFNSMLASLEMHNIKLNTELDERKRMQAKLDRLAHYDTVTYLPNRHYFQERLKLAVAHSTKFDKLMAVLFVDLDNFKLVNDSFGHHIGDKQLQEVAGRLSKPLRAGDIVCRLGGDEFAVILENLPNSQQAELITEKIIQNLTLPLRLEDHDIVVTGSIGMALCPEDAETPEALLRFADTAMYAAKGAGKNTWRRFDPEMASQSTLRLTLENQMRSGLEEGHFEVHYQPQVNMLTGEVYGLEALARWNHPERGYISPTQFIPVAEESGLIRPLGEWVLRTACKQIVAWSRTGNVQLKVAVNVSVRQMAHASFAHQVLAILAETGCKPEQLELEITESVLMQHSDKTRDLLERLHAAGIGIAIDDFGTGYSSMAQLKNMPVTKLKIDKSFIDDIATDHSDQAITTAMTSLARSLKIHVIAEGVESKEQVVMLQESGCHDFQGYHFARPMPAAQVPAFIDSFQRQQAAKKFSTDDSIPAVALRD
jgi:diguanylate cyclase (GGDEF)-like protein